MSEERLQQIETLKRMATKTARAWALNEQGMAIWKNRAKVWARAAWIHWYSWAIRSRLEPAKKVVGMIKAHLEGATEQ